MTAYSLGGLATGTALLMPWLLVALLILPHARSWVRRLAFVAPLPALWAGLLGPGAALYLEPLLLGSYFGVDDAGRPFVVITAIVWIAAGALLASRDVSTRFLASFVLAMAGNIGVVLSQDLMSFFTSFALMSFAAYGLIVEGATAEARRAGRVYMVLTVLGEVLIFSALLHIAWLGGNAGTPGFANEALAGWTMAAVVLGFGIKAGLVPLHFTLPLAYAAAPAPAGVALAGAMLNAGLLGWLRLLPLGAVDASPWGIVLLAAGLVGALWGVIVGLLQSAPRAILAYSSISQVGVMMLGLGAGLMAPAAWATLLPAVLVYMVHHAIAKATLFYATAVRPDSGFARLLWIAGLVIAALALAGAPLTSGAVAKTLFKSALDAAPSAALAGWTAWLPLGALGTALLMTRFLAVTLAPAAEPGRARGAGPAVLAALLVLVLLGGTTLPAHVIEAWPGTMDVPTLHDLWAASWPIVLAASMAALAVKLRRRRLEDLASAVPNGDIAAPLERLAQGAYRKAFSAAQASAGSAMSDMRRIAAALESVPRSWARRRPEQQPSGSGAWPAVFVAVLVALTVGLWLS